MKTYYFRVVSITLLILSFIAFSDNLITDIGQDSNSDPKFIIHGLFLFAWFILFVIQTFLIARGKIEAHMRVGKIGFICAIGVFLSTVYVFIAIFKGLDAMAPFVKANRLHMLSFAIFITLAYVYRMDRIKHKRFIFWAIALPIEPIMGRVSGFFHIDDYWVLFYAATWHILFISFFIYDWKSIKRIHPISWIGILWFYLAWVIAFLT